MQRTKNLDVGITTAEKFPVSAVNPMAQPSSVQQAAK